MRKVMFAIPCIVLALAIGPVAAEETDVAPGIQSYETAVFLGGPDALGDVLWGPIDTENGAGGDRRELGVEYAWGYYWITGTGLVASGQIHQFDSAGNFIASFPQVGVSGWGGRDLAADEANFLLYTGNELGNLQQHKFTPTPGTGTLAWVKSYSNPALGTIRALCIDDEGKFWTTSWDDPIRRFQLTEPNSLTQIAGPGVRIGSPVARTSMYGFGWDPVDNTIWSWGQSGVPQCAAHEWEPDKLTGNLTYTGKTFQGKTLGGGLQEVAGGCDVYCDDPNAPKDQLVMMALHQTTPDQIILYDLDKNCAIKPCPGDFNCDGLINFDDIDVFVAVLGGAKCPCPDPKNCDPDGNGVTNFDDIDKFITLLGTPCP